MNKRNSKPRELRATEQFRIVLTKEEKRMLRVVAHHEWRPMGSTIKWLVAEKYKQIQGETNDKSN